MFKVRALLTADIGLTGYRQFPVATCESFAIDGAMDTDADQFSVDIGAPTPALSFLLDRDNEVRASLFTESSNAKNIEQLHTGIADVVTYTSDDMVLSITGRDYSSLATDSQAPPGEVRHVRPDQYVLKDAQKLGFSKFRLSKVSALTKFYRDGSESYWDSWYRMYRKRKMWIWTTPDGTLVADKLHYSASPSYFFGRPRAGVGNPQSYLPVERVEITKGTQQRVGDVWVFGERGDIGFVGKAKDPTLVSWKRRPLKIMTSSSITSHNEAIKEAWEEIFEGKVGSLEITVTVPLASITQLVRQNSMAFVNVPEMGLLGIFFVVGVRAMGSASGYSLLVRLREKNYAISRRIPSDPQLKKDPANQSAPGDIGQVLRVEGVRWGTTFATAAHEFHDGWDYALFLGVLMSIAYKESTLKNVREGNTDLEWYAMPPANVVGAWVEDPLVTWHKAFANKAGNPLNPFSREAGVGPMQLTDAAFKVWADEYAGNNDEYEGGRWIPQTNIRAGARVLAAKLAGLDPKVTSNIWIGVEHYNGSGEKARAYRDDVHEIWKTRFQALAEESSAVTTIVVGDKTNVSVPDENGNSFDVAIPNSAPGQIKHLINYLIRQRGKPFEWAAVGPNSFDCSGLVYAAYKIPAVGIDLSQYVNGARPTTYNLFASSLLTNVKKDQLLPGDMVFFTEPGANEPGHMGIYLNDGHFIHAPHTGDVVKISPMNSDYWSGRYNGARRVIDWGGRGRSGGD